MATRGGIGTESDGNNPDIGRTPVEETQAAILLELEIILSTVKSIDANVIKSIELLQNTTLIPANGATSVAEADFNDLIKRTTGAINTILEQLNGLQQ